ncbi:MAG: mechanosensitive ion channel [Pseudomonadota bacterium]|nr:mechanosensitive ion channel [Pseudomonadota bacterium]
METTSVTMQRLENYAIDWGPRILAAIAIMVVAYFVGKGVKWALAKGIDKVPGLHHANEGSAKHETVGARLGDVGYWLVLLIGLILALNTLQLTGVTQPLNSMLQEFGTFVPNLVGAGLLFFVGFILATIAKRLVVAALEAANLDGWLERAGLSRLTGAGGIARAIGTLVFVLIIIPVAISALQILNIEAISTPAVAVLNEILAAIPNVLAAAIVLAIAFVIARWVASLIEQLLPSLGFDNSIRALGNMGGGSSAPAERYDTATSTSAPAAGGGSAMSPSKIVGQVAFAAIMIFAAVEAARLLQFAAISEILAEILALGGQVIFGGVIIAAGVIIANLLSRAIDKGTGGADGIASNIVKWATIALSVAIGLRFMGLANDIITLAFGLILGSAAVAFALAVGVGGALAIGLGGREQGGRMAQRLTSLFDQKAGGAQSAPPPAQPTYRPPAE